MSDLREKIARAIGESFGERSDYVAADAVLAVLREQEPVAVVGEAYGLFWAGNDPIVQLVERTGVKVGSKLYAVMPPSVSDHAPLIANIKALLDLDAKNALVPHGIGGHARNLLSKYADVLATAPTPPSAPDALLALDRLVLGLDATHWSSWQNTSRFSDQLEAARRVLAAHMKPGDQ